MGENKRGSAPAVGGSSLLVIFAVLCLTVFALLALSTVQADLRLGDAAAQTVESYYQADAQAQEILSRLRAGERPQGVEEENGLFSYPWPISDTQTLQVEVKLEGETYTVLRWQADYTGTWQADEDLSVWTGES